MTPYASLDTLKESLGVPLTNVGNDAQMSLNLDTATSAIRLATGRRFDRDETPVTKTFPPAGRTMWTPSGEHLLITPDIADITGMVVETGPVGGPWVVVPGTLDPWPDDRRTEDFPWTGIRLIHGCWPMYPGSRARITVSWGWPAIIPDVETSCLIITRRLLTRKDSPSGVLGTTEWAVNVAKNDPDVVRLLGPLTLPGFG